MISQSDSELAFRDLKTNLSYIFKYIYNNLFCHTSSGESEDLKLSIVLLHLNRLRSPSQSQIGSSSV